MRILYLHLTASFGGSSKSLIELWKALAAEGAHGTVLCPPGPAAKRFRQVGLNTIEIRGLPQWDDTRASYYRGWRWLILLREILLWPTILWALWRLRNSEDYQIIHANELNILQPAILAKWWLKAPLVVHVRSLQRGASGDVRTRWITRLLARHTDAIVAIDETVRATLPQSLHVEVIHNSLNAPKDIQNTKDPKNPFRVAIIGTLLPSKGVYEFIEAARICTERGMEIEFIIAGENVRRGKGLQTWLLKIFNLSWDVRAELELRVQNAHLEDRVKFLGFVDDVQTIYRGLDVLCFPSHLDAAGRPVFEAAFFGVPSIVAARNPTPDTIRNGETGICIPDPDPLALANALERLYLDPSDRARMGKNALEMAHEYFDPALNAQRILDLYRRVVSPQP